MRRTLLLALAAACFSLATAQLGAHASDLQHFDVPGWDGGGGPPHHPHAPPVVYDTPDDDDAASPPPAPPLPPKPAPPPAPGMMNKAPAPAPAKPPQQLPPGVSAAAAAAAGGAGAATTPPPPLGAAAITPALVSAAIELRGPEVAPWTPKAEAALTDGVAFMLKVAPNAVTVSDVKDLAPGPPATPHRRSLRQEQTFAGTSLILSVATTVADAGAVTEHLLSSTAGTGELATALGTRGVQTRSAAVLRTDTVVLPPASGDEGDARPKPSPRVSTKHAVTAAAAVLAVSAVAVAVFMSLKRWLGGRDGGAVSAAEAAKATVVEDGAEGDDGAAAKPPARTRSGAAAFFLNARSPRGAARRAPEPAAAHVPGNVESYAI